MAEGYAAVHAARGLEFAFSGIECLFHFAKIGNALVHGTVAGFLTRNGQKGFRISHFLIFGL